MKYSPGLHLHCCKTGVNVLLCLFPASQTKMLISVGLTANKMLPVNSTFDTNGEPNVIQEVFLEADWLRFIQANNGPLSRNATNRKISIVGTITLRV